MDHFFLFFIASVLLIVQAYSVSDEDDIEEMIAENDIEEMIAKLEAAYHAKRDAGMGEAGELDKADDMNAAINTRYSSKDQTTDVQRAWWPGNTAKWGRRGSTRCRLARWIRVICRVRRIGK